ncbi:MAG: hypothetical protein QM804_11220 [Propionicimonas sp.]
MTTGTELLAAARVAEPIELAARFGRGTDGSAARAALVAALLSQHTDSDRTLIRHLTQLEIDHVQALGDGCGDVLLACCWLLFRLGEVGDSALVWRAKQLNFDTHCYIDSEFLAPRGGAATVEFARAHGLPELADWVGADPLLDDADHVDQCRESSFFGQVPPADAPAEELASWIRP